MPKPLPTRFSLQGLEGPHARQYAKREDAFQQLVGDGLRSEFGPGRARIAPTEGRDGSIDGFVDSAHEDPRKIFDLSLPVIVECKDHDDRLPAWGRNVDQGWLSVERKLRDKAAAGWPGAYAPWKEARGYLYCVSAVLTEQVRRDLTRRIQRFFDELSSAERPPIQVKVLDWADIRFWLGAIPRVIDGWMGVGLERLLGHEEYVARLPLSGFLGFLQDTKLPFVPPPEDAPFHPDRLLDRLDERRGSGGVLLVGAGGVGKTRTALEVANRAHRRGWRVLHALPVETGLNADVLANVVLEASGPTLVVLDYLDQMRALDLGAVRRLLLPKAAERGVDLTFLATSRRVWKAKMDAEWESLLEAVRMHPEPHQRRAITRTMLSVTAPLASATVGQDAVARACGDRPIIALMIALEFEQRASSGALTRGEIASLRPGDLTRWLDRRFQADGMNLPSVDSPWHQARPEPHMVAAAAALAAAPQAQDALVEVAASALRRMHAGGGGFPDVVEVLQQLGWLERSGPMLSVAHDVVADELLKRVLLDGAAVRTDTLEAVLAAGRSDPRTLGRLAVAMDRLMADLRSSGAGDELGGRAAEWLRRHAESLGASFAAAVPDVASYALGAILGTSVWGEASQESWDVLVGPWLTLHGRSAEARHLLRMGLRSVPRGHEGPLITSAITWLLATPLRAEATFVLGPLLERRDLAPSQRSQALHLALRWLRTGSLGLMPQAQYVLTSLLGRPGLEEDEVTQAVSLALSWLEHAPRNRTADAGFLLPRLLGRPDLVEPQATRAIQYALAWLRQGGHGTQRQAAFLLRCLLERRDLPRGVAEETISLSLAWGAREGNARLGEAAFVHALLLARKELRSQDLRDAAGSALAWVRTAAVGSRRAALVLRALLSRRDLDREHSAEMAAHSLAWLREQTERTRGYPSVLRGLLSYGGLGPRELDRAAGTALAWLRDGEGSPRAAARVLRSLLWRSDLGGAHAKGAIDAALEWLRAEGQGQRPEAGLFLDVLLRREDLQADDAAEVVGHAISWLRYEERYVKPWARRVLSALLGREGLGQSEKKQVAVFALAWLGHGSRATTMDARLVLTRLLGKRWLEPEATRSAIRHGLAWLCHHARRASAQARFVIEALLARPDLDEDDAAVVIGYALTWLWLPEHAVSPEAKFLLTSLLARGDLSAPEVAEAIGHALGWLEHRGQGDNVEAVFVLAATLHRGDLNEDDAGEAIDLALGWLSRHADAPGAARLCHELLKRGDLKKKDADRVIAHALAWLDAFEEVRIPDAGRILGAVIARREPARGERAEHLRRAKRWLARNGHRASAHWIYDGVLRDSRSTDSEWCATAHAALTWLPPFLTLDPIVGLNVLTGLKHRAFLLSREDQLKLANYEKQWFLRYGEKRARTERQQERQKNVWTKRSAKRTARYQALVKRLMAAVESPEIDVGEDFLQEVLLTASRHAAKAPRAALEVVAPVLVLAARNALMPPDVEAGLNSLLRARRLSLADRQFMADDCERLAVPLAPEERSRFRAAAGRLGVFGSGPLAAPKASG